MTEWPWKMKPVFMFGGENDELGLKKISPITFLTEIYLRLSFSSKQNIP